MIEFAALRPKIYGYLTDTTNEDRKVKSTKVCIIKRKLKIKDYSNSLEASQLENEISYLEKVKLMCIVLKKVTINS